MNTSTKPIIVVGASGSCASRAALRWAADEADRLGGRLIAVRAWEPSHPAYYAPHAEYGDRDHEREAVAAELASTLRAVSAPSRRQTCAPRSARVWQSECWPSGQPTRTCWCSVLRRRRPSSGGPSDQ